MTISVSKIHPAHMFPLTVKETGLPTMHFS